MNTCSYCPLPTGYNISSFPIWLFTISEQWKASSMDVDFLTAQFFYYIWFIWKARNEYVFKNQNPNPMATLIMAKAQCWEFS